MGWQPSDQAAQGDSATACTPSPPPVVKMRDPLGSSWRRESVLRLGHTAPLWHPRPEPHVLDQAKGTSGLASSEGPHGLPMPCPSHLSPHSLARCGFSCSHPECRLPRAPLPGRPQQASPCPLTISTSPSARPHHTHPTPSPGPRFPGQPSLSPLALRVSWGPRVAGLHPPCRPPSPVPSPPLLLTSLHTTATAPLVRTPATPMLCPTACHVAWFQRGAP